MESQNQKFVPRVNQLDARQLDKEILKILREAIIYPLQNLAPRILIKYQPEINLLLDSSIWCLSIAKNLSTFGQQILLISYDKNKTTRSRLTLHFLLSVLPKYLKDVSEHKLTKYELLQRTFNFCEHMYILLSIVNFFRFLKTGKYPILIDFIIGMDCISRDPGKFRRIGYDYMTRELLWAGYMEFLGTILPFINYYKLRRFLKKIFNNPFNTQSTNNSVMINAEIKFDLSTKCIVCNERPTHPHKVDCGHVFCYYCIFENIQLESGYCCPLCDIKVNNVTRVQFERVK